MRNLIGGYLKRMTAEQAFNQVDRLRGSTMIRHLDDGEIKKNYNLINIERVRVARVGGDVRQIIFTFDNSNRNNRNPTILYVELNPSDLVAFIQNVNNDNNLIYHDDDNGLVNPRAPNNNNDNNDNNTVINGGRRRKRRTHKRKSHKRKSHRRRGSRRK